VLATGTVSSDFHFAIDCFRSIGGNRKHSPATTMMFSMANQILFSNFPKLSYQVTLAYFLTIAGWCRHRKETSSFPQPR
jgi:hypothetical protein